MSSQATKIRINVFSQWWGGDDITVQGFVTDEDGEKTREWCNHAQTHDEEETVDYYRADAPDITMTYKLNLCDKCPAWRVNTDEGYGDWEGEFDDQ